MQDYTNPPIPAFHRRYQKSNKQLPITVGYCCGSLMEGEQNINNVWRIIFVVSLWEIGRRRTINVQGEVTIDTSFPKLVRVQLETELDVLPRTAAQSQRRVYSMSKITRGLLVYFSIHGYEIHPDCGAVNRCPHDQRSHIPEFIILSAVMKLAKQLQGRLYLAARPPISPCPNPGPYWHTCGTDIEDLPQHGHCGEPEDSGIQGGATARIGHQCGVGGGLEERPKPLNDAVAVCLQGEMEGGASRTVHPNCCIISEFGKYELITADGSSFLRSTEHCSPWTRRSRHCIRGGARRIFWGGGVSNNEKIL